MRYKLNRNALIFCAAACTMLALTTSTRASGGLSAKQIRKLVTHVAGVNLPSTKVRIKTSTTVDAATVDATVEIETAFSLQRDDGGQWRVSTIRTGPKQWEEIELLARVLKAPVNAGPCDDGDAALKSAAPDLKVEQARCLIANLLGVQLPSDAVRVRDISSLPLPLSTRSSALVIATIDVDFRLSRSAKGDWRIAGIKTGDRHWVDPEVVLASLNSEKASVARTEMEAIAKALENFRHDRGFFVESNSEAVLIDYLSPHYLASVIRLDPWQRPYRYEATRDHFTLRSIGPDGKENTEDDIVFDSVARH